MKKVRMIGFAVLAGLWVALVAGAWFGPVKDISESERRKLAQMPTFSADTVFSGKFMSQFEDFTLDQFPLRDSFRTLKALVHYNVLQQGDNNNIYVVHDFAAKLEYPLNETSVEGALPRYFSCIWAVAVRAAGNCRWLSAHSMIFSGRGERRVLISPQMTLAIYISVSAGDDCTLPIARHALPHTPSC